MTKAESAITVDPSGSSMLVDVQNMAGQQVTVYDAPYDGSEVSMPLLIDETTTFYLASAGDYLVSAKVNGREVAGANGSKAAVTPPRVGEVRVVPVLDTNEQLGIAAVTAATVPYDNTTSTLTADDVQAAIDELVVRIVDLETP